MLKPFIKQKPNSRLPKLGLVRPISTSGIEYNVCSHYPTTTNT